MNDEILAAGFYKEFFKYINGQRNDDDVPPNTIEDITIIDEDRKVLLTPYKAGKVFAKASNLDLINFKANLLLSNHVQRTEVSTSEFIVYKQFITRIRN